MTLDAFVGEHDPQQRGELITAARLARLGDDLNRQNTRISVPQQIMRVTARPGIGSKVQRFKFASYHGDYIIAKDGTKVAVPYAARTIPSDDNILYSYDEQTRQAVDTDDPSLTDIEHQVLRRQYKDGRELIAVPLATGVFANGTEIKWIELSGRKWVPVPVAVGVAHFKIDEVQDDILACKRYKYSDDSTAVATTYVAKSYLLRTTPFDGVTTSLGIRYVYVTPIKRLAVKSGAFITEFVTPSFLTGYIIKADRPQGGTGTVDGTGKAVVWEMQPDRQWAKE